MSDSFVGSVAPDFRLASAQGGELGPQDFRGAKRLVLWFSKGLFCPFCRRNMAQLGLRYPEIEALGAEVLQVTHNTLDEARGYLKHYPMKFPYLCDAERTVHGRYGVELISGDYGGLVASSIAAVSDLVLKGQTTPAPVPFLKRYGIKDAAQAVFLVDREGIVRAEHRLGPNAPLPSAQELVEQLGKLA